MLGLHLYYEYTDPAQHLIAIGEDLDDIYYDQDRDLSGLMRV